MENNNKSGALILKIHRHRNDIIRNKFLKWTFEPGIGVIAILETVFHEK